MRSVRPFFIYALMVAVLTAFVLIFVKLASIVPADITESGQLDLPELHEINAADHLRIKNKAEAFYTRQLIIDYLWPKSGALPNKIMPKVVKSGPPSIFFPNDLDGIEQQATKRVDLLAYRMLGAALNYAYRLLPNRSGTYVIQKPIILHQGHQGGLGDGIAEMANALLDKGHEVVLMQMPMVGWNHGSGPYTFRSFGQRLRGVDEHNRLFDDRDSLPLPPMTYFIEPVIAMINFLVSDRGEEGVGMVGLSGGGWTTHVVAAVDPRISESFPVAGSYPLYLRPYYRGSTGDAEQIDPGLYVERATWLE